MHVYYLAQGEVLCVEKEIARLATEYPYVAAFGPTLDELQDPRLVIENNIIVMPNLSMALHACFAAYFVFDIQYPMFAHSLLLFLEKIVYEFPSSQRLPTTVITFMDSISKIKV